MSASTTLPIVFTDLDGTLLDHEDYGVAGAEQALELLRRRKIPLVLCSSKTAAEIAPLRAELGFAHCAAIVENGAGLLPAHAERAEPAAQRERLLRALQELPTDLRIHFSGFSDWSLDTLARATGLDIDAAGRAAQRDYSEPGRWYGDSETLASFTAELARRGVRAQRGGRFLTLGFEADKVDRMLDLLRRHRARHGEDALCIALGDAPNDIAMLRAADVGIIVPNPAHDGIPPLAEEQTGHIRRAQRPGPAGWAESLLLSIDAAAARPGRSNHG
ncbi:MAG: HAD-IIB family hydrolase [Gammaproteobacteria bacterium]|nr:HAD-IIB family hydrolase [Gammaproteobacteria bacterium]